MAVNGESIRGTDAHALARAGLGRVDPQGEHASTCTSSTGRRRASWWSAGLRSAVKRATLLANESRALRTERAGAEDLVVHVPATAPDAMDSVIALEVEGEPAVDGARLLSREVPVDTLRAFDGQRMARASSSARARPGTRGCAGGRARDQAIAWPVRLTGSGPATFEVSLSYDAEPKSAGGRYHVRLGEQVLAGTVERTPSAPVALGRVQVPTGRSELRVEADSIAGGELMRLRALTLTPVGGAGKAAK